jgi:hypothetical protein
MSRHGAQRRLAKWNAEARWRQGRSGCGDAQAVGNRPIGRRDCGRASLEQCGRERGERDASVSKQSGGNRCKKAKQWCASLTGERRRSSPEEDQRRRRPVKGERYNGEPLARGGSVAAV